jgi:MFS family permease
MKLTPSVVVGYFLGGAMIGSLAAFWVVKYFGLPDWWGIPYAVGALAGGALSVYTGVVQARQEQQYEEELTGLAEVTEFRHTPRPDRKELGALLTLPILKTSSEFRHRLVRLDDSLPLEMIDVSHLQGSGKHKQAVRRTVVVFPGGAAGLPDLWLRPLGPAPRPLFGMFPKGGVTFDPPPREEDANFVAFFAKHYLLAPLEIPPAEEDERALAEQIRRVFSLEVLRHFAENLGWEVQTRDGHLALWHGDKPCPAPDRPALLVEALQFQEALTRDPPDGRTVLPGSYRRDMYRAAAAAGLTVGGAILGFFLGGIIGAVLLVALSLEMGNARPDWKVALAWLIFIGSPLLFAFLGGYVGYRWRRGRPARPREG